MTSVGLVKPETKHAKSRRNEEALLDALESMLEEGFGFDQIGVDDLVKRAGCAKGTFYNRFENKYAIFVHLFVVRVAPKRIQALTNAVSEENCKGKSIREIIHAYLVAILLDYRRYRTISMAIARLRHTDQYVPGPELYESSMEFFNRTLDSLCARLFERVDDIGHPDPKWAVQLVETCATLCIKERVYYGGTNKQNLFLDADDEKLVEGLTEMFVRMLQVKEPGSSK